MSTAMAKDINYFGQNYLPLNVRIVTPEYLLKQYSEEKEAGGNIYRCKEYPAKMYLCHRMCR